MPSLRDEIRAILREEFAALRSEMESEAPKREHVRITSSVELTRFARDLVTRAADPAFAARVSSGELEFELAEQKPIGGPIVSGPVRAAADVLDKALITERDITMIDGARQLRISKRSRLTPLARDEARRRGIRIERSET